ncbi:uncharacterized protein EI90DRAFT_1391998 [Cantharellus anzutake]|uniref:uncharacterized protein n=1 Tax=Cantharellus anzutake TaxID=1750568 RepID=UPI001907C94B|nr:uncharacterized protein EI90DRAFT_1391998 [Cantharellus anzutake]KAF8329420.1 hypothetical protein EI90DRAFT_1391998 [Cantharellus anzutake]
MSRRHQIFQAARILSHRLGQAEVAHAFHGGFLATLLGVPRDTEELFCIVDRGFLSIRDALNEVENFTTVSSTWSNRMFATYAEPIPPVEIEIVQAGEGGPRQLNQTTIQILDDVPFLSPTEFLRAKIRAWAISAQAEDATDIAYVLARYWSVIDINRIPDDMERFVQTYPQSAPSWQALQARYE